MQHPDTTEDGTAPLRAFLLDLAYTHCVEQLQLQQQQQQQQQGETSGGDAWVWFRLLHRMESQWAQATDPSLQGIVASLQADTERRDNLLTGTLEATEHSIQRLQEDLRKMKRRQEEIVQQRTTILVEKEFLRFLHGKLQMEEKTFHLQKLSNEEAPLAGRLQEVLWLSSHHKSMEVGQLAEALGYLYRLLVLSDVEHLRADPSTEEEQDMLELWKEVTEALLRMLSECRPDAQHMLLSVLPLLLVSEPLQEVFWREKMTTSTSSQSVSADTTPRSRTPNLCSTFPKQICKLLLSINDDVKAEAAALVDSLCTNNWAKSRWSDYGVIESLLGPCRSPNTLVQEKSLRALWSLTTLTPNRERVRECGGMEIVVNCLQSPAEEVVENAVTVLGYLTRNESNKHALREAGGIELLIFVISMSCQQNESSSDYAESGFPAAMVSKAAAALWNCASLPANRVAIREKGGIPALVALLMGVNGAISEEILLQNVDSLLENVTGALWNCVVDDGTKTLLRELEVIPVLVRFLDSCKVLSVRENISGILWNCAATAENRVVLRNVKGMVPLLKCLVPTADGIAPSASLQENAAGALRNMLINDTNKTVFASLGGGTLVIQLLEREFPRCALSLVEKLIGIVWMVSIVESARPSLGPPTCQGMMMMCQVISWTESTPQLREKAFGVLRNCSADDTLLDPIREAGALDAAVAGLQDSGNTFVCRDYCAALLWSAARSVSNQAFIRRAGAIEVLIMLLRSPEELIQSPHEKHLLTAAATPSSSSLPNHPVPDVAADSLLENCTGALMVLASDEENRQLIVSLDGVSHSLNLLRQPWSEFIRENVLALVRQCLRINSVPDWMCQHPHVLEAILESLLDPSEAVAREAALCVKKLSTNPRASQCVGNCGGLEILVSLLEGPSPHQSMQKLAAVCLNELSKNDKNRERLASLPAATSRPGQA